MVVTLLRSLACCAALAAGPSPAQADEPRAIHETAGVREIAPTQWTEPVSTYTPVSTRREITGADSLAAADNCPDGNCPNGNCPIARASAAQPETVVPADAGDTHDDACDSEYDTCCQEIGCWRENTLVFIAADGWKNIGDSDSLVFDPLGDPGTAGNNFGYRNGFNTGLAIFDDSPIRAQVGGSYGAYNLKGRGRNYAAISDDGVEQQVFITSGIYKRSDICNDDRISWALVGDYMYDNHWGVSDDNINVAQVRGIFGYAWDESNEFGIWATLGVQDDDGFVVFAQANAALGRRIQPQDQVNFFWHRTTDFGGDTMLYLGWADDPGSWVIGANGQAPLSSHLALFGGAHYVVPGAGTGGAGDKAEVWNVTAGLVYYFGTDRSVSRSVSGHPGLPLLNVADNGTFAVHD